MKFSYSTLYFLRDKFHQEILTGSPCLNGSVKWGRGEENKAIL